MEKSAIKWILTLAFLTFTTASLAQNTPGECRFPDYLSKGFDINRFNQCDKLMKQCPGDGVLHEKKCVDAVVRKNQSCAQFLKLVNDLKLPANQVTVTSLSEFYVVKVTFPADGQFSYLLISPNGCMLDTKIDPRSLQPSLKAKYFDRSLMLTYASEPQYQTNPDGTPSITSILRVTDTCIACPLLGYARIKFDFDKHGNLVNKTLVSFDKNNPKQN